MADEILNTLGFSVDAALTALRNLDSALQQTGTSFSNFAAQIDNFNSRAEAALNTMRGMASAASKLASASQNMGVPTAAPAAATGSQLWLPEGVQSSAQQAAASMAAVGNAAQQAGQQAAAGMNQAANATKGAKQEGDHLIVSWNTISRVVMTQAIVRAMSMMRDALKDAVTAAEDFQVRLAEIQTIAPRIGGDLSKGLLGMGTPMKALEDEVTSFSKSFNVPLPQVEEGLYQTLSNQFTSVADRSNVMTAAMKLAKVGVMDFQSAILLISGTLNAYGMGTEQADSVAMKFFETIRLGRVRGKELADTMGQIAPIAGELGVSLDEVSAALVSMTIGGIDAHKSVTALRGVMTAFMKPSEDMKKTIRSMGFSDPSQLIAAKGFEGALQAIADKADGMGSEIAKSIRNVRALTAELRLTSDVGAKKYQEALEAMQKATPENLDKILGEFRSTDTERLQTQINALKVNLTQDFGQAMVKVLADVMEFMGGADKLAAAITAVAAAAIPCAAALGILAAGFALVHLSLGPIGIALLAVSTALALLAGGYTYTTLTNIANINKESDARHEATMKMMRDEEQKIAKMKETQQAEARAAQGQWSESAATIRRDYFQALDDLKTKNQETITSARNVMESMIGAQERVVAAFRNASQAAMKAVQESQQRVNTLQAQYSDARFKYAQKGLDQEVQADNYRRKAMQEALQAANQLANAKSPEDINAALSAFQRADAKAKEAESIANATKNTDLQGNAERTVLAIMQMQVTAEKQLQAVQAEQAMKLAQKAAQEQARVNEMKTLMKSILTDLAAFDKKGEAKTPQALEEQQKRLQENIERFRQLSMTGQKVDVSQLLAFDTLQRRVTAALEGGVSKIDIKQFNAVPESFAALREQIEKGIGPIRILIEKSTSMDAALAGEMKGMSAEEAVNHLEQKLQQARQQKINFNELTQRLDAARQALSGFASNTKADIDKWINDVAQYEMKSIEGMTAWSDVSKQPLKPEAQKFLDLARKFSAPNAQVNDADYQALLKAHDDYVKAIKPSPESEAAMQKILQRALAVKEQAQAVQKGEEGVQKGVMPAIQADQRIKDIEAALRDAKAAAEQTQQSTGAAAQGASATTAALGEVAQVDMSGLVGQITSATSAMWGLVAAAQSFQMPDTAGAEFASHGGLMRYFAKGGAVGVDTVPAMLAPGEFVMSASSTRKFASQLFAMNAGIRPVYRSEGGSVTNIGDINVTVQGGGSSRQTARSIASELRRELRRGTSTL
ncbi:MAG: phage tail tape measure protein [Thermoguttaceae bacterium]